MGANVSKVPPRVGSRNVSSSANAPASASVEPPPSAPPPSAPQAAAPPTLARASRPPSLPKLEKVPITCLTCVSDDYDFTRSTKENFAAAAPPQLDPPPAAKHAVVHGPGKHEPDTRGLYGKFRDIRATLDTAYHGYYTRARQEVQDSLICQVVDAVSKPEQAQPWIVFTAGAMGAGKSRTINWMAQRGIFPLQSIVQIDADVFKTAFPEWPGYVSKDPLQAGYHTRHESGYLVELAQEVALRAGKHVWVDGSLRDGDWYERVFRTIRRQHSHYRIAILYVHAEKGEVMRRALERGAKTGRYVPEAEILDSLERVPKAVYRLSRLATFVAEIDNTGEEPHLSRFMAMQDLSPDQGVPDYTPSQVEALAGVDEADVADRPGRAEGEEDEQPQPVDRAGSRGGAKWLRGASSSGSSITSGPPVAHTRSAGALMRSATVEWEGTRACFDGHDRWDEIESRLRSVPVETVGADGERHVSAPQNGAALLPLKLRHVMSSGT